MSLITGTRVGPFEVLGVIGAGGMGVVYKARDVRLGRDVALKSLPANWRDDPDRLARLQREAQILASLNHPHIAGIHGIDEADGTLFLVLEFIDGETLAARLGSVSIAETLSIARQIADALEAAHEKGIVHRDLKPGNVAVTRDGEVKVFDFGLAKVDVATSASAAGSAGHHALSQSPTTLAAMTTPGMAIGTPLYMSPEQVRGLPTDRRTDIWAFGCVLYAMLTGKPPFGGDTPSDVFAAVLEREPDLNALPRSTPSRITWLVRRCLEKDLKRRLHDIADARIEIDDVIREQQSPDGRAHVESQRTGPRRREALAWALAAVCLVGGIAVVLLLSRLGDAPVSNAPKISASVVLPDEIRLGSRSPRGAQPAGRFTLSPDGKRLVLVATDSSGRWMLWVRSLDSTVAQPIAGTEGAEFPFWSPDSGSIGFIADEKLKRISLSGGPPITLAEATINASGTWNKDNIILFTPRGRAPIHRVSASGGTPAPVTTLDAEAGDVQHWYPFFLPDGNHFLYFAVGSKKGGATDSRAVMLGSLDSTEPAKLLVSEGSNAKYANGHLLYSRSGTLVAQRFNLERLELEGEAFPLVEQVQIAGLGSTGTAGAFTVSETGTMAYQAGAVFRSQLAWFDRSGTQVSTVGEPADYGDVMLSPDGGRAAVSVVDPAVGTRDLWVFDLSRGLRERVTFDPGDDFAPIWSRQDGKRITFSSRRQGNVHLYQIAAGGGPETLLWQDDLGKFASDWSSDGQYIVYIAGGGIIVRSDLWILPLAPGQHPHAMIESSFPESHGQFSPDGRWLSYMSLETGRMEIYATPFPGPGERQQVSTAGGRWARWRRDGREIFYLAADDTLMVVPVSAQGARLEPGAARPLFKARPRPFARLDAFPYDVSKDGQRILINTRVDESSMTPLNVVMNWPPTTK